MEAPSCDHVGRNESASAGVTCFAAPPLAGTTKIPDGASALGRALYAIDFPSGDHEGSLTSAHSGSEVTCSGSAPSASAVQTSAGPVRFERNAIRVPSGEYDAMSSRREEEISGVSSADDEGPRPPRADSSGKR